MKINSITLALAMATTMSQAAVITLLDEEFTNGTGPADTATASWSTTDPSGLEVYNNGGFGVRGISGGGTPLGALGGLEVLNEATESTVMISILLPTLLDVSVDGVFTFLAGQRISGSSGGFEGDLEIVNVTDGRTLRAKSAVEHPNFTMALNTVALDFLAADAGDTLELRFYESGSVSDRGLQLADFQLDVTAVPEPSAAALLGVAGLALAGRRRRG